MTNVTQHFSLILTFRCCESISIVSISITPPQFKHAYMQNCMYEFSLTVDEFNSIFLSCLLVVAIEIFFFLSSSFLLILSSHLLLSSLLMSVPTPLRHVSIKGSPFHACYIVLLHARENRAHSKMQISVVQRYSGRFVGLSSGQHQCRTSRFRPASRRTTYHQGESVYSFSELCSVIDSLQAQHFRFLMDNLSFLFASDSFRPLLLSPHSPLSLPPHPE